MAATIGAPVLDAIGTFLDYGSAAMVIMVIWFIVKFFFMNGENNNNDQRAEKFGEWWNEFREKGRQKREEEGRNRETAATAATQKRIQSTRERLAKPVTGWLLRARIEARELFNHLSNGRAQDRRENAVRRARQDYDNMVHQLRSAVQHLRTHLHRQRDRALHNFLDQEYDHVATLLHLAGEIQIPAADDANWGEKVREIGQHITTIRADCDAIVGRLNAYIERAEMQEAANAQQNQRNQ